MSKIIRDGKPIEKQRVAGQVDPKTVPSNQTRVKTSTSDDPSSASYKKRR